LGLEEGIRVGLLAVRTHLHVRMRKTTRAREKVMRK
jgi:hypothetical protein